jgi:uncharacterized protein (DUF1330 family)
MAYERIMGLCISDDEQYQKYREGMMPILHAYGGAFGFDFKVSEVLLSKTSDDINRVFTIEFPSKEKMDAFFECDEYLAVREQYFDKSVTSKTVISLHEKT